MKSLCKLTSDGTPSNTHLSINGVGIPTSSVSFNVNANEDATITALIPLSDVELLAQGFLIVNMPDGSHQQIKQIVLEDGTILE